MSSGTDQPFLDRIRQEVRLLDVLLLVAVPVLLVAVYLLPVTVHERLVFRVSEPTLVTAYTAHFVHTDDWHLLGNLSVYAVVASMTYLCCLLSGRRRLFRWTFVTVLVAFPLGLSAMQLSFPRERVILGFSGINAAFFGALCFLLAGYVNRTLSARIKERDAPALLFVMVAIIALVTVPSRAWREELVALIASVALLYVVVDLYRHGTPDGKNVKNAVRRKGYFEFAGAGFGLLLAYPVVGFQQSVLPGGELIDLYVHLLGFSLGFIVVYASVFVFKQVADEPM